MRFLVDNSLSWRLADWLRKNGHDAVHVAEIGMRDLSDADIYARACKELRLIIAQDADFSALLASDPNPKTGVIYFRLRSGQVAVQTARLQAIFSQLSAELIPGRMIVVTETAVRIRQF